MVNVVRILFPTDLSKPSAEAGEYAFTIADKFGAELHVLNVVEAIAPTVAEGVRELATFPEDVLAPARESAQAALAAALPNDRAGGSKVVRAIRVGAPRAVIIDYAKEHQIDLIVMGTFGRTGIAHFLVGSVTEYVVRHSPCPVLSVPPRER